MGTETEIEPELEPEPARKREPGAERAHKSPRNKTKKERKKHVLTLHKQMHMPIPAPKPQTTGAEPHSSSDHLDVAAATTNIATERPHLDHLQQPISTSNRTSPQPQRRLPTSTDPRHPSHWGHSSLPTTSLVPAAVASPVAAAPHTSEPMDILPPGRGASRAQSRPLPQSHLPPGLVDLHAHQPHSQPPLAGVSFPAHIPPVSTASIPSVPMDWGMYGVAHSSQPLHPSQFEFELPGAAMIPHMPHHGHMSPTVSDPSMGYGGGGLVSPSSIHSSQGHYGFSSSWDDQLGHEGSTPTVSTPAAQVSTNPWTDPEELQQESERAHEARPKKAPRSRRTKKETRRPSDARSGASPDAASPSSTSQHSRASIGSKTASMASSSIASSSVASSSTTSSRPSKLRSASRTSKNSHTKPTDTPEERRTRASHNLVEKQYRNRLNAQFESLLGALPEQIRSSGDGDDSDGADWGDRRVSKGEVLEMARKHIKSLERERDLLEQENNELQGSLAQLKNSVGDGSDHTTPLDFNISMDDDKDSN